MHENCTLKSVFIPIRLTRRIERRSGMNLTEKQKEVLKLVCLGLSNKEIADTLYVSSFTSKAHVGAILRRLNVKNRSRAAYLAGKNNLI